MKVKCPKCGKKHKEKDYHFEWSNTGYKGKCPSCKTKLTRSRPASGFIRTETGQLIRKHGGNK